jgi:hypothetical protein
LKLADTRPAFAEGFGGAALLAKLQSVFAFAALKLRRTRFDPTVSMWLA